MKPSRRNGESIKKRRKYWAKEISAFEAKMFNYAVDG
ncbi:MAG: hypothetical protein CM15mP88_3180 [Pseudomonadota bacterium]|nr:MAG: hypothetical protein CM15mP88_3180 [Pseudomonadota bacterium]